MFVTLALATLAGGCGDGLSQDAVDSADRDRAAAQEDTRTEAPLDQSQLDDANADVAALQQIVDEAEIDRAIRDGLAAWRGGDLEGFLNLFTDRGLLLSFYTTKEAARDLLAESVGDLPIALVRLGSVEVSGDAAMVEYDLSLGVFIKSYKDPFARAGGTWRIDGKRQVHMSIPPGTKPVDVQFEEFRFVFNPAGVTTGDIAFRIINVGQQPHELVLVKVEEGPPLLDLLEADEVEFLGQAELAPGGTGHLVLAEPLEPGRYGLVCLFPDLADPEGTLHAYKGMVSEFMVP